jgi:hypothetical protein
MKRSNAAALLALVAASGVAGHALAQSAVGRTFDYRATRPSIELSSSATLALGVHDQRQYVVSTNKPESWVGLIRSRVGIPFDVHTKSGDALSSDVAFALVQVFGFHKVQANAVTIASSASREQAVESLIKAGLPKALLVTIEEWRTDTYTTTRVDYRLRAELFDGSGKQIARNDVQGSDPAPALPNPAQTMAAKLGELLRGPIAAALQDPHAPGAAPSAVPAAASGSLLMQQVQCKVGDAPAVTLTRLACSQQNGELVTP